MKLLNFNKVLCISPHPDDVEFGMSGTMMKFADTHFVSLCLTICGGKGFDDTYLNDRILEVEKFWERSGHRNIELIRSDGLFFEDKDEQGWINFIDNVIDDNEFDCVFIPPKEDSMFEHRRVNGFGYAVIRKTPISLIEYHTVSTTSQWLPNLFVDITKFQENKFGLLKSFTSQLNKPYFSESVLKVKDIDFQFRKKGVRFAEKFKVIEHYG